MENLVLITESDLRQLIREELMNFKPSVPEKPTFKTRKDAARELNISLVSLAKYTKQGMIPATRIGGRVLYNSIDLDAVVPVLSKKGYWLVKNEIT